jgi:hypothetical protein
MTQTVRDRDTGGQGQGPDRQGHRQTGTRTQTGAQTGRYTDGQGQ